MNDITITTDELDLVRTILARHIPDREVRAFGSRVTGPTKKFSDLDLAIMGELPLTSSVIADLEEDFRESSLPFKVDIADWASTSEQFRQIIRKEYVVVQEGKI